MNTGTKLRTALRIAVSINTAIYAVSAAVAGLGFHKLTVVWAVLTIASDLVTAAITTYYNNDYTEAAAKHTGAMRLEKQQMGGLLLGENFQDDPEPDEDGEDLDQDEMDAPDIDDGPNDGDDNE